MPTWRQEDSIDVVADTPAAAIPVTTEIPRDRGTLKIVVENLGLLDVSLVNEGETDHSAARIAPGETAEHGGEEGVHWASGQEYPQRLLAAAPSACRVTVFVGF